MPKDIKEVQIENQLKEEEQRLLRDEKKIKAVLLIGGTVVLLLIVNLAYLNYGAIFKRLDTVENLVQPVSTETPTPSPISKESSAPIPETTAPVTIQNETTVKEHFVVFGSGPSTAKEWADVGGLAATVDLGSYGNIKEIKFEASVAVPTENQSVSVRLFNKTDKHPVWYSEVTMNGGASAYLVSSPIVYDKGAKTYQVQMLTQLGYTANLGQARLHIILK
jgi:hypothetical protein